MYALDEILKHKDWCIRCRTEADSFSLLRELDARGLKWNGGDSYLTRNNWRYYGDQTVYYIAEGLYGNETQAELRGETIIEFDGVLFNQQPIPISMTFEDMFGGLTDD